MRQRLSGFPLGCVAVCLALLAITSHGLAAPPLPPETVLLKKQLAYALEHSGKEREAAAVYRQLLAEGAADQEAIVRFTWLLTRQRRYRDALDGVADATYAACGQRHLTSPGGCRKVGGSHAVGRATL